MKVLKFILSPYTEAICDLTKSPNYTSPLLSVMTERRTARETETDIQTEREREIGTGGER